MNQHSFSSSWQQVLGYGRRGVLLLALGGLAPAAFAQTITFSAVTTVGTGTSTTPRALVASDVNRDGKLDVVTSDIGTSQLSILLGNGMGGFILQTTRPSTGASTMPYDLAVGDLNGDGWPDVVTANTGTNAIGVLMNTGMGTFANATSYSLGTGTQPRGLALADVNKDGKLDALTANYGNNTVSVLLGNGLGGFTLQNIKLSTGTGTQPQDVAIADVNGDGKLDALIAVSGPTVNPSSNAHTLAVLLGNGLGGFTLQPNQPSTGVNSQPVSLVLGDVNNDGKLDALTANFYSNKQGVLLGDGAGSFALQTNSPSAGAGGSPAGVAAADLNGDSKLDFVTANSAANKVAVLVGDGLGNFSLSGSPGSGSGSIPYGIITADVNGDGKPDVITANTGSNTIGVQLNITVRDVTISSAVSVPGTDFPYNTLTIASGGFATLTGSIKVVDALIVQSGGTFYQNCQVVSGMGSFTLQAGGTLGICNPAGIATTGATGSVLVTGTRSFSNDASYVYNGTQAQVTGSGLPSVVRNLSSTNSFDVTLTNNLSARRMVVLEETGDIVLNGKTMTVMSNSTGTALIVNNNTGIVRGNTAVVQRYVDGSINPGVGYRHYSSPVANSTVGDFATPGFTPEISQGSVYNSSATPGTTTPYPNIYAYDQTRVATTNNNEPPFAKGYFVPASLSTPLEVGRGYTVRIKPTEIVDFVGQVNYGNYEQTLFHNSGPTADESGWNLVGNPYPSPLDWSAVNPTDRDGLDGAIYVAQSDGEYTGSYRAYVNGETTTADNNPLVPSCQGFFVHVSDGLTTGTLTFRNSQRVTDFASQVAMYRPIVKASPYPRVQLDLRSSEGLADALVVYAQAGTTPAFDSNYDALKIPSLSNLNLASLTATGRKLAIDGRPVITAATTIPLLVSVPAAGTYTLQAASLTGLPAGLNAYLTDAATGQTVNLNQQASYEFTVTASQATTSLVGRFALRFGSQTALATATALTAETVTAYPNPAHESVTVLVPAVAGASAVQAELLNVLGQVVRRQSAALPAVGATLTLPTADLAAGPYVLRLQTGTNTAVKRIIVQ